MPLRQVSTSRVSARSSAPETELQLGLRALDSSTFPARPVAGGAGGHGLAQFRVEPLEAGAESDHASATAGAGSSQAPIQRAGWKEWGKRIGLGALAAGGAVAGGLLATAAGAAVAPVALAALAGGALVGGAAYGVHRLLNRRSSQRRRTAPDPVELQPLVQAPPPPRPTAEERLARWHARGEARRQRGQIATGRYSTPTGPVTLSGGFGQRQRMSQTRRSDYDDETLGSYPSYRDVRQQVPASALAAISDPSYSGSSSLSARQRMATSTAVSLQVSEEHRAPGYSKLVRALTNRHRADPTAPHPLDPSVNVAITSADRARRLMSGTDPLNPDHRAAIDGYASDSSDEDDDYGVIRKGLMRKLD